jgi:putative glycerol-1-phosphate prenyltransferase
MKAGIYQSLAEKKKQGKKSFAVLIDPDKVSPDSNSQLSEIIEL